MNTHHTMSAAGAVILAFLAGFFFVSAHTPSTVETHEPEIAGTPAAQQHHALVDMYAWAALHLDEFREMPETFGESEGWSNAWDLHWIDVQSGGGTVRLYHASSKHDPGRRFVCAWNAHEAHCSDWLAAR